MKILGIHSDSGSRYYRMIPQLKQMQKAEHEVILDKHSAEGIMQKAEWADVIILQMVFSEEFVRELKSMGKVVIFECDDLMHSVPKTHYSYQEIKGFGRIKQLWRVYRTLRLCDGFIASNRKLERIYGWVAKNSLTFPNYLELEHWLKEEKKNTSDKIRLLWGGSTSHHGDLMWIKPVLKKILEKYPQVQFIYIGTGGVPTDDLYARFVYGEDLFEDLPRERRESMLAVPGNVWPYVLASQMADIAIAPLEKNYFNKFKTQCKYLEYAVNAIPGVYSKWFYTDVKDLPPTIPIDERGQYTGTSTGLLADTHEEWIRAISFLIENATIRKRIGANARETVIRDYNSNDHIERWQRFVEQVYESSRTKSKSTSKK